MADWKVWQSDPDTGVVTYYLRDGDLVHYKTTAPAGRIIDENKRLRASMEGQRQKDGIGNLIARVPMSMAYGQGISEALVQNDKRWMSKWLNDGDNAAFRVKEGRT
tara:strand:+ start:488 stop:805 length:318 start_codon:yes stop_codon:yes gene_type:complete